MEIKWLDFIPNPMKLCHDMEWNAMVASIALLQYLKVEIKWLDFIPYPMKLCHDMEWNAMVASIALLQYLKVAWFSKITKTRKRKKCE